MMLVVGKEPYDDNQFYESIHGPGQDWPRELVGEAQWEQIEPRGVRRDDVASYEYKHYSANYAASEREGTLLPTQKPRLTEASFLVVKKRLLDWFTVADDDRRDTKTETLIHQLLLNRYQRHRYEEYVSRFTVAKKWGRVPASDDQLSETEFLEMKRRLLRLQLLLIKRPQAAEMLDEEVSLRRRLFPPVKLARQ